MYRIQIQIVKDPDLKERHLGVLRGITRSEALQTNREACRAKDNYRGQIIIVPLITKRNRISYSFTPLISI